jgi:coniferyl-aldehyde dehydrogenase
MQFNNSKSNSTKAVQNSPINQDNDNVDDLAHELQRLRQHYELQRMPDGNTRKEWLLNCKKMLLENQQAIIEALNSDFKGRSGDETRLAELMPCIQGINYALHRVKGWMRPQRRFAGLAFLPASARISYQPLGVVGIVVPWNYPLFLAIGPLTAALSAGNRAMIKMPEHTPVFSALFARLVQQYLGNGLVKVINGGPDTAVAFTQQAFDHLIFTGSTQIGRHVMRAAADKLTPVTLELGGKSPVIISDDINIDLAAERICFGKSLNAGQTCVAPDYVLVPEGRMNAFIAAYKRQFSKMYPAESEQEDYSSMINEAQAGRIKQALKEAEQGGACLHPLSDAQSQQRAEQHPHRINPVLVTQCPESSSLLKDEIFGPVLPLIPYQNLSDAIEYINERPRPLALYFFGHKRKQQRTVIEQTHSGGVCINETMFHVAVEDLPFGGIGPSGMGHYHAKEGFLTLSKAKAVFSKGRLNSSKLIYPPYNKWLNRLIYKLFIR